MTFFSNYRKSWEIVQQAGPENTLREFVNLTQ